MAIRNRSYTDKTHLCGFQLAGTHADGLSLYSHYVFLPEPLTQPKLAMRSPRSLPRFQAIVFYKIIIDDYKTDISTRRIHRILSAKMESD
ncbi:MULTISPECIES: hypothetical protein [unclassified Nostoc]|uniref:hypothetical protein n=1 Tax=unclassified Nostoc TaxID=2593658 RepID=UPI002AD24616|nr:MULTISPECIES: hypothetical protein [unclassified Nostoc]MDZ8034533.1 hypothetical protein [Nostoc sp. DedSLP04]MDZ8093348.1 hypothetical protein [Nostoc sp. DedQUE05]MDZ8130808.1 hypothetical protein [Nostoc sp. DedQUE07]MDZ8135957.1 hypothetical protein [Nostoc sp. DedQUE04]